MISGLWATALKKIMALGVVSATLLASVFVIVDLAPGFTMDAILGAIVGVIAGSIVSLMVFVAEQELAGKREGDAVGCTIFNVIIGGFTGMIVVATAVTILDPAMGLAPHSPNPLL